MQFSALVLWTLMLKPSAYSYIIPLSFPYKTQTRAKERKYVASELIYFVRRKYIRRSNFTEWWHKYVLRSIRLHL